MDYKADLASCHCGLFWWTQIDSWERVRFLESVLLLVGERRSEGKSWFSLIPSSPSKPSKTASWHLKQLANRKRTRELHHDALFDTSISVCTFGVLQYQILTTVDKQTQNSMVPKLPHFPDLYPITGACWLLASG